MVVDLRISQLGRMVVGEETIADPSADPAAAIEALAAGMNAAGVEPTCILGADSGGLSGQIAGLTDAGFSDFILSRESGSYTAGELTIDQ